ncbi:MAG: hypothetical protein PUC39_04130, partial [Lachnospiraceae bacterium]|nr:hypothetical protein [Lachnospiraceae bacterium]
MKRAKRFLSLVLAFALVLGSSSLPSGVVTVNAAEDSTTSATLADFTTESDDSGGIIIKGYTGTATALNLPEIFEGKNVTQIGEGAFSKDGVSGGWATGMAPNGNNIVSVIIPKTVT